MVMRYHWGLGIGHTYSHDREISSKQHLKPASDDNPDPEEAELTSTLGHITAATGGAQGEDQSDDSDSSESEPEKKSEDTRDPDSDDTATGSDEGEGSDGDSSLELYETYH